MFSSSSAGSSSSSSSSNPIAGASLSLSSSSMTGAASLSEPVVHEISVEIDGYKSLEEKPFFFNDLIEKIQKKINCLPPYANIRVAFCYHSDRAVSDHGEERNAYSTLNIRNGIKAAIAALSTVTTIKGIMLSGRAFSNSRITLDLLSQIVSDIPDYAADYLVFSNIEWDFGDIDSAFVFEMKKVFQNINRNTKHLQFNNMFVSGQGPEIMAQMMDVFRFLPPGLLSLQLFGNPGLTGYGEQFLQILPKGLEELRLGYCGFNFNDVFNRDVFETTLQGLGGHLKKLTLIEANLDVSIAAIIKMLDPVSSSLISLQMHGSPSCRRVPPTLEEIFRIGCAMPNLKDLWIHKESDEGDNLKNLCDDLENVRQQRTKTWFLDCFTSDEGRREAKVPLMPMEVINIIGDSIAQKETVGLSRQFLLMAKAERKATAESCARSPILKR